MRLPLCSKRVLPRLSSGVSYALTAVFIGITLWMDAPRVYADSCPGEGCCVVRPQDEIFTVSVRALGCTTDESRFASEIRTERYDQVNSNTQPWSAASLPEFFSHVKGERGASMPTIIYAHGNRIEANEFRSRGLWVYSRLVACRADERPIRFVIFAWPSDEVKGSIRDARIKAARTKPVGYQLAWLINQTPPEQPLGLLGYSYGARVISGATHLLAGGKLGCLQLSSCTECASPRAINAVYVAPAFDADWLAPGGYHGRSTQLLDSLLITKNQRDPAMRFYGFVDPNKRPQAMGYEGPVSLPRETRPRVRLLNVASQVGRTHDMCKYMAVRGLMSNAWRRLTFSDAEPRPVSLAVRNR